MPVSVIVGGQFGSEGKGKVAALLARDMNASVAVRCGGSNSGHTVYDKNGKKFVFQHLPTACIQKNIECVIVSGAYIDTNVLLDEINFSGINPKKLHIDPNAVIITQENLAKEKSSDLMAKIGSTGSGTGHAVAQRVSRLEDVIFAKDIASLQPYLRDTKALIAKSLKNDKRVIVEGTQGFGLSLLHSDCFPYVTSRDTTASGFISECGISPLDVDDIILTIRSYPIRVSGNSGPLESEISWATVSSESGSEISISEYTSVTKRLRRVGRFDPEIVKRAVLVNKPTKIVLNHLDYISPDKRADFVRKLEDQLERNIDYVGESNSGISVNSYGNAHSLYLAAN